MASARQLSDIDVVTSEHLLGLAGHHGPSVSLFLPTSRRGPDTIQGPLRLKNLVRGLEADIESSEGAAADQLLGQIRTLIDTADFWQHQADGLALFATTDELHRFRVPMALRESATFGSRFRLAPLLPLVAGDRAFFILALSQHSVRLFSATGQTIDELATGSIPASIDEALSHEDHERQLQSQSIGGTGQQFHGHGVGEELDKQALERYFRAVDRELTDLLGSTRQPVILACVDYYLPIYRSVTALLNLSDAVVSGNPEHTPPEQLHASALALLEPANAARRASVAGRFTGLAGTGNTLASATDIVTAAREGRVDTLLIAEAGMQGAQDPEVEGLLDEAVAEVLLTGGTIETTAPAVLGDAPMAAILRY